VNPSPDIGGPLARILIVDDDHDSRQILQVVLNHEGFLTVTAASGEEALASVAHQPPDLILVDGRMPGMDGYEVVAKLKGDPATANIPIIMITGMTDDASRRRGLSAGAVDIIAKPVGRADVVSRVKNALRFKTSGDDPDK
jgi:CheY-like chemotaxis protein